MKRIHLLTAYVATLYYFEIIFLMFGLLFLYGTAVSITAGALLSLLLAYHIIQLYYRKKTHRAIQLWLIDLHAAFAAGYLFYCIAGGAGSDPGTPLVIAVRVFPPRVRESRSSISSREARRPNPSGKSLPGRLGYLGKPGCRVFLLPDDVPELGKGIEGKVRHRHVCQPGRERAARLAVKLVGHHDIAVALGPEGPYSVELPDPDPPAHGRQRVGHRLIVSVTASVFGPAVRLNG